MRDMFHMVTIGLVVAILALLVIAPYRVEGDSMEPSYHNGQYLLIGRLSYRSQDPQPGDVVVFKIASGDSLVKRVIRQVGPGKYWVEGDNKEHSSDSRTFGPIDKNVIVGKVLL